MPTEIEYRRSSDFLVKRVSTHTWFPHRENNELVFLTKEQLPNFGFGGVFSVEMSINILIHYK